MFVFGVDVCYVDDLVCFDDDAADVGGGIASSVVVTASAGPC